ncbi:MAG: glycine cleavage system aminomethyltransferase GcvT [Alphaproteobacteria bacterium]|nr:MAG: glycine cleavage system aminomethyltransferase GcvT [Alphaproteobacteria bacterium]
MSAPDEAGTLLQTPLAGLHAELGGKMVGFAGYALPVQYPAGVLKEHLHCRASAALFDVSHMGQIVLEGAEAAEALESLVPVDVLGLKPGRQRYAMFTNADGGILDDLMVANLGERLFLVVNAACKAADFAHLQAHLGQAAQWLPDRALIALQGPKAGAALARHAPGVTALRFMDVAEMTIAGADCIVSRSGYTGEDGFEISVPAGAAEALARALIGEPEVEPAGLGARDSLRLEAGLCLYGSDIDTTTSPVEANLAWAIQKVRRRGGAREGGFPGAERILRELETGPARLRVGLKPEGRAPVRAHAPLFDREDAAEAVGAVTSGGFAPSLGAPVAMGYLPAAMAENDTRIFAELRGRRVPMRVCPMPFHPTSYKRN